MSHLGPLCVHVPGHIFHQVFRNSMGLRLLEAMLEKSWEHFFSLKTFSDNLCEPKKTLERVTYQYAYYDSCYKVVIYIT